MAGGTKKGLPFPDINAVGSEQRLQCVGCLWGLEATWWASRHNKPVLAAWYPMHCHYLILSDCVVQKTTRVARRQRGWNAGSTRRPVPSLMHR